MAFFKTSKVYPANKIYNKLVDSVEGMDAQMQRMTDLELQNKTAEFKRKLSYGESIDSIRAEALAVAREAFWRTLGMKPYKVQVLAALALDDGYVVEMKTGEGKTLSIAMAAYLNALTENGVHVVTANDYLVDRDTEWMGPLYDYLGVSVGKLHPKMSPSERREAYLADITYGTAAEFGFDYLRDSQVTDEKNIIQRGLSYAIVDEADHVLIDRARGPLSITAAAEDLTDVYLAVDKVVNILCPEDFLIDEEKKTIQLQDEGLAKVEKYFDLGNLTDEENAELNNHIMLALRANFVLKEDIDYVVTDGLVVPIDQYSGRLMFGSRFSGGLHQALEAKHGLTVGRESNVTGSITIQNFYKLYRKISGATGTAMTEAEEFLDVYNMEVIEIPTNLPIVRNDYDDLVYSTVKGKDKAIVSTVAGKYRTGQPVLLGTISIEKSEHYSRLLTEAGIPHNVLNAKNHKEEAYIIAQAGRPYQVTIATSMAGRGTDILLGGNPEILTILKMREMGYDPDSFNFKRKPVTDEEYRERTLYTETLKEFTEQCAKDESTVRKLGGLCIIGTERYESRRIDNQFRGRAGRQGDPGETQFFISLQDDLMRIFGSERAAAVMEKMSFKEDKPIRNKMLTQSIEGAQKKVEGRNYDIRKSLVRFDNVINDQRKVIFEERRKVLTGMDLKEYILSMLLDVIQEEVLEYTKESRYPEEWDLAGLEEALEKLLCKVDFPIVKPDWTPEILNERLASCYKDAYDSLEITYGEEAMRNWERECLLFVVDENWFGHIDSIDYLRKGIGLRAVGHLNPLEEFKKESFDLFNRMVASIRRETVKRCFSIALYGAEEDELSEVISGESA